MAPLLLRFAQVATLVLALTSLPACSDDSPRRNTTAAPAPSAPAESAPPTSAASTGTPSSADQPYRVLAETAYLYLDPQHPRPSGNYLRRGDVLYGHEAGNGLVQTQFKQPNGATATAWVKAEEVGRLTPGAATRPTARRTPQPAAAPAAEPDEPTVSPAADAPEPSAGTAVVQVPKAYFYDSPELGQPRRAHCVPGDKVQLGERQGEAVYVTFTNWEGVTTRGWMRRSDLR